MTENPPDAPPRYRRKPEVEDQIAALPPLGSAGFWAQTEAVDEHNRAVMAVETLIYCVRQFVARGDRAGAQRCGEIILRRYQHMVRKLARLCAPRCEADVENFSQELFLSMWRAIFDPAQQFWECAFHHALVCRAHDVARSLRPRAERKLVLMACPGQDGPDWPEPRDPHPPSQTQSFLERVSPEELQRMLPPDLWLVVSLYYFRGMPIDSSDPARVTIAGMLGVTEKTVRNRLQRALATVRATLDREESR